MRLFAIGDLHMPGGDDKPMDVFGPQWDRHFLRISEAWRRCVGEEDLVLIPGDISWAMQLEKAIPDLMEIAALPGRKILCKGNHEYWWSSVSRVRAVLPDNMTALQFDAVDVGPCVICGTRGWNYPTKKIRFPRKMKKYLKENSNGFRWRWREQKRSEGKTDSGDVAFSTPDGG